MGMSSIGKGETGNSGAPGVKKARGLLTRMLRGCVNGEKPG